MACVIRLLHQIQLHPDLEVVMVVIVVAPSTVIKVVVAVVAVVEKGIAHLA